jgi:pantoate--beta-alanine ligase
MVKDLNLPIQIRICPIVRETDGLAMSSRNRYLAPGERGQALVLSYAIQQAKQAVDQGERDANQVKQMVQKIIASAPHAMIDYVEIVDSESLEPISQLKGSILIAVAVEFGKTRLIDNVVVLTDLATTP